MTTCCGRISKESFRLVLSDPRWRNSCCFCSMRLLNPAMDHQPPHIHLRKTETSPSTASLFKPRKLIPDLETNPNIKRRIRVSIFLIYSSWSLGFYSIKYANLKLLIIFLFVNIEYNINWFTLKIIIIIQISHLNGIIQTIQIYFIFYPSRYLTNIQYFYVNRTKI